MNQADIERNDDEQEAAEGCQHLLISDYELAALLMGVRVAISVDCTVELEIGETLRVQGEGVSEAFATVVDQAAECENLWILVWEEAV